MKIDSPLLISGYIIIGIGILIVLLVKIPFLSRLPGNIVIKRENFVLHFPLGFCIFSSIILTVILNLLFNKK
ncbi:DUF2905 domain-containing protein [candidate division WOR-3 bacterium]|nr:DUF2905 domain-containing protein [candidate division WOR-3 bacterium]